MRSLRAAPLALAIVAATAFAVAACGSANRPGWTFVPAPSVTPPPSAAASAPASAPASGQPSEPVATASAPAESAAAGDVVTVVATTPLAWDTPELTAPADTPFTLSFDNQDPTVPHNVVIKNPDGSNVPIGDTTFFTGPEVREYAVPALAAGEFQFVCEVHPTAMIGTLTVE